MTISIKKPSKIRGFTLIELMVVLTLIGISLGAVSFAIGDGGQQRKFKEEVIKVQRWIKQTQQSAIVGSKILALDIQADNRLQPMQYWDQQWRPIQQQSNDYKVAQNIEIKLTAESPEVFNDSLLETAIVFFPDGEMSPFKLRFVLADEEKIILSNHENLNEIEIEEIQ